jgi:trans-2,3-dihydro-3-hydroxyanthranilate isomerase
MEFGYAGAMAEYEIRIVDAFTTIPYAGNQAAVLTRADGLGEEQMQAIAREMNLSETAFVFPSNVATFRVRFFTPAKEIPLAGHPTIATMHALAEEGRIDVSVGRLRVTQELSVGVLPVDLARDESGRVRVAMTQAAPEFLATLDPARAAEALGLDPADCIPHLPVQVVSTGTPQVMVPVRSLDVLRAVQPDYALLAALERDFGYFSTHVFTLETLDPASRAHSRHFLGGGGPLEDPVTGSASGGMAAYLWRHGLVRERRYTVEQGHLMGRPGLVEVEVEGDGDEPRVVRVAGSAVTVLRGTIRV